MAEQTAQIETRDAVFTERASGRARRCRRATPSAHHPVAGSQPEAT